MRRRLKFLKEFVTHPRDTGALTPSSRFLSRRLLRDAEIGAGQTIAEYGPGTGAITRRIIQHLRNYPDAKRPHFFAVELNPDFAAELGRQFPGLRIHVGCVSRIADYLASEKKPALDVVVSGLPWTFFPEELQESLLRPMVRALAPGGRFVTFAYIHGLKLPAGRRFRRKIEEVFGEVEVSPVIWRNIPPAVVYRCRRVAEH